MLRTFLPFYLRNPETDTGGGGGDIVLGDNDRPTISGSSNAMVAKELTIADDKSPDSKLEVTKPVAEKAEAGKEEPAKTEEDPWPNKQAFLDAIGAKDLKPGDKRLEQWDQVKGMLSKATDLNSTQSVKLATLERTYGEEKAALSAELAQAKASVKDGTGTPADVKLIQADLASLKAKYEAESKELQDYKAKEDIRNNSAFKQKYEGGRANLFEGAKEAAKEVGVTDEQLNKVFGAKTEYEMRKNLDALDIKDPTALALVKEKALEYIKLSAEMDAQLSGKSGKSPSEVAAEWRGYEAQLGGSMTQKFSAELQGKALAAVAESRTTLGEKHTFFKTDGGEAILEHLEERLRQGYDIPMKEVIESVAIAETAPIWEKLYYEQETKLRALENQISQLTGNKPSKATTTHTLPAEGSKGGTVPAHNDPFQQNRGSDIVLGSSNRMVQ